MKRTLRILLNAGAVLSALLCLGAITLWGRSHYKLEVLKRFDVVEHRFRDQQIFSTSGAIAYGRMGPYSAFREEQPPPGIWRYQAYDAQARTPSDFLLERPTRLQRAGFVYHRGYQPDLNTPFAPDFVIGLPYWTIATAFSLLPLARGRAFLTQRRRRNLARQGKCPTCGYDLRATPHRCPECGATRQAHRSKAETPGAMFTSPPTA